jgi:nicotinamide mononucleotide adenylyltransferase
MLKKRKVAVAFLRGMGLHLAHLSLLRRLDEIAKSGEEAGVGIVFIGSSNVDVSIKNPFSFNERLELFSAVQINYGLTKLVFLPLPDFNDNAAWTSHVQERVQRIMKVLGFGDLESSVLIVDAAKNGAQSNYSTWFPDWGYEQVELVPGINATAIRHAWYEGTLLFTPEVFSVALPETINFMDSFEGSEKLLKLRKDFFAEPG